MKKQMRISDFLNEEEREDDEQQHKCRRRSVFSRWISSSKRSRVRCFSSSWRKLGSPRRKSEGERIGESFDQSVLTSRCVRSDVDGGESKEKSSSSSVSAESRSASEMSDFSSGRYTNNVSFNLGLGAGLCFLIAASKNEFNKMMELQTQIEILLKEIKNEIPKKDVIREPFESNEDAGSSTTSPGIRKMNSNPDIQNCILSPNLLETKDMMQCDSNLKCDAAMRAESSAGIDQLEAELEAELEYLQLRLDAEATSEHPLQQMTEKPQIITESTASNESCVNLEEDDPQEADCWENCGVSPNELERKLHELLEARQQERIKELESALESTNHKLHLKETEVSWWKDIAELISQHVPYATHLSR